MTNDDIQLEFAKLPDHQQQHTREIWRLSGSMRVCWICGDEAEVQEINGIRGYICQDCHSIQTVHDSLPSK